MDAKLSKIIGISRSSYYYKSKQKVKDWNTKVRIENCLVDHVTYGHKRIADHLGENKKKILRVMKLFGIKPYRRTAKKRLKYNKRIKEHPNLLLTTIPEYYGHIWATDFTYIRFKGKWIYVSTIIDLYSRKIVGLSISTTHNTQLIMNTLLPALLTNSPPKILHSDNGKEYLSGDYDSLLDTLKIVHSCSRPGCPWENGYQESFYKGFKLQLGDPNRFATLGELVANIYGSIYYYNYNRIHSALKTSPNNFLKLQNDATIKRSEKLS